jgi:hypothetical protein
MEVRDQLGNMCKWEDNFKKIVAKALHFFSHIGLTLTALPLATKSIVARLVTEYQTTVKSA